ncbi:hypothetical protein RDI58_010253 [Solanum bulbocastanum]|uniref:Uncharacterized protein n=1 Tax=Solanum bulbocastanum TaxID=147425 RepID=A0AAN8YG72_SOLBU
MIIQIDKLSIIVPNYFLCVTNTNYSNYSVLG